MTRSSIRLQCLRLAAEMRAGNSTPQSIIENAKAFETYVGAEDYRPQGAALGEGTGSPEKAGARVTRVK